MLRPEKRFDARVDPEEALNFAAIAMKASYDRRHVPISLKEGDIFEALCGILCPQRPQRWPQAGPQVIERISNLAYLMAFPDNWRMHNVVSIA
jgi:hypothetical protein